MSTTKVDRKFWTEHFNQLKSQTLADLKTLSNFIASNSQLHDSKPHRTQQIKAVASENFIKKISACDSVHEHAKVFQRDAVRLGFDQARQTFQNVTIYRKACKALLVPVATSWGTENEAGWPGLSKETLLNTLIAVADDMRTNMKHLSDAITKMRVELTPLLSSKEVEAKFASDETQARKKEIEEANAKAEPKPEKKRKPVEIDDEAEEEEDEDGEDLGDEDTADDDEDRVVEKKPVKNRPYVDELLSVEEESDDSDEAFTSSSGDDVYQTKVVRRVLPKRKSEQLALLIREQTAADAAYQEDFAKREKLILECKAAMAQVGKKRSVDSVDEADDKEGGTEVVEVEIDDESDGSAYDYKEDHKRAKKERGVKRRRAEPKPDVQSKPVDKVEADDEIEAADEGEKEEATAREVTSSKPSAADGDDLEF